MSTFTSSLASGKAIWIATYSETRGNEHGNWKMTSEGKDLIHSIPGELCVIGIAGAMRTGKSYIMNLLADVSLPEKQLELFDLGKFTDSKTRGVWGFVRPNYNDPSQSLLILDFEGMFDTSGERINPNFDAQIFLLSVLVSSYVLYNTMGTINNDHLNKLGFVAEVGRHLHVSSSMRPKDDEEEDGHSAHFPDNFAWIVRDFSLVHSNSSNSDDMYLEDVLKNKSGYSEIVTKANAIRSAIKGNFKNRRCFTLPRPIGPEELLQELDQQPFSSLVPDFRAKVKVMLDSIVSDVKPKQIKNQSGVGMSRVKTTSREFLLYFETLLEQLNTSHMFCVEDAWSNVARKITTDAFDLALTSFVSGLSAVLEASEKPVEAEAFSAAVDKHSAVAFKGYITTALLRDDEAVGAKALKLRFADIESTYQQQNALLSEKHVSGVLDNWFIDLNEQLTRNAFADNKAYEVCKQGLFQQVGELRGSVGPAWATMEGELLQRLKETDRIAALRFQLTAQEIEMRNQVAESCALKAMQDKLQNELEVQLREQKAREERWQQVQLDLQKEHKKELEEQRELMDVRLKKIALEAKEAQARGDHALAEQKLDSDRKLREAILTSESKHSDAMHKMQIQHQESVNDMKVSQEKLEGEIAKVKKDSEETAAKHKEELDKANENKSDNGGGGNGGGTLVMFHPQYGWIQWIPGRGWARCQ